MNGGFRVGKLPTATVFTVSTAVFLQHHSALAAFFLSLIAAICFYEPGLTESICQSETPQQARPGKSRRPYHTASSCYHTASSCCVPHGSIKLKMCTFKKLFLTPDAVAISSIPSQLSSRVTASASDGTELC